MEDTSRGGGGRGRGSSFCGDQPANWADESATSSYSLQSPRGFSRQASGISRTGGDLFSPPSLSRQVSLDVDVSLFHRGGGRGRCDSLITQARNQLVLSNNKNAGSDGTSANYNNLPVVSLPGSVGALFPVASRAAQKHASEFFTIQLELFMGQGKSSTLSPNLLAALANSKHIAVF